MRRRLGSVLALAVAMVASVSGCASAGMRSRPVPVRDNILPGSEVLQTGAQNALRAIELARPKWLASETVGLASGADRVQVYVESTRYNDPSDLQRVSATTVREVEFLNGSEATTRFGRGHSAGAILVRLKR
jgi:hypothetical protein